MADQAAQPRETVEVKRRRLRFALRDARKGAAMTQQVAARKLSWSSSKIVRIEQGSVPVTPTDVRAMLSLYGVTDKDDVETLATLAIEARESKGYKEYEDVYSQDALELFGSEAAAKVIYKHEPTLVPGIMQTQEYARSLLLSLGNNEDVAARKMEARIERQTVLEHPNRPELNFILGEAVLCRPIGGVDVMQEQIEVLRGYSRQDDINLYILPFAAGGHRGLATAFTILQFANPDDSDVLYLENADRLTVGKDDDADLRRYLDIFVRLKELSERWGDFETQLDRIVRERFGEVAVG